MLLELRLLLVPHVLGDGKVAVLPVLQLQVVLPPDDAEEPLLAPVRSPAVPDLFMNR